MKRFAIIALLALSACATGPKITVGQSLYMAYGSYGAAARSFAEYANGPTADPQIVAQGRRVVDSPEAHAAVGFGRAYVACRVDHNPEVKGIVCADWDFSHPSGFAIALRNTAATLAAILAKGKTQ